MKNIEDKFILVATFLGIVFAITGLVMAYKGYQIANSCTVIQKDIERYQNMQEIIKI